MYSAFLYFSSVIHVLFGLPVLGILSLGKLDEPAHHPMNRTPVTARDIPSRQLRSGLPERFPRRSLPSGRWTPLTVVSSPSAVSSRPSYMLLCLVLLPFRSADLSKSLYAKADFGLRLFQLLINQDWILCLSLWALFCKGIFFFLAYQIQSHNWTSLIGVISIEHVKRALITVHTGIRILEQEKFL